MNKILGVAGEDLEKGDFITCDLKTGLWVKTKEKKKKGKELTEVQKRKLLLRKVARKVFENMIMKSEILEVTVEPETDRNEFVSIQTGFSKVTFRIFKQT